MIDTAKDHQSLSGQRLAGGIILINKPISPRYGEDLTLGSRVNKLMWRVLLVALMLAALVPSIAVASKSIVPLLFTLVVGSLFLALELPSSPAISPLQYIVIRVVISCMLFGTAFFLFQAGLSEFSSPYIPSRYSMRLLFEAARAFLGPTAVAIMFFSGCGLFLVLGFNYLRTGKATLTSKAPRKAGDGQP